MSDGGSGGMAAKFKKLFKPTHSSSEGPDGGKDEEEGASRSARFADTEVTSPSGSGKKKGQKKEVRVQEPPSEDGEQPQKAKATSVKKSAGEKKGPPPVSYSSRACVDLAQLCVCMFRYSGREKEDQQM